MFKQLRGKQTFSNINDLTATISFYKEELDITSSAREVLSYLGTCAIQAKGACTVLYATIADKLSFSLSTVKRAMSALKKANVINVELTRSKTSTGGARASIITILPVNDTLVETLVDTLLTNDEPYSDSDSTNEKQITTVLSYLKKSSKLIINRVAQIIFKRNLKTHECTYKKPTKLYSWFD